MRSALFSTWAPAPQNVCTRPCLAELSMLYFMQIPITNVSADSNPLPDTVK